MDSFETLKDEDLQWSTPKRVSK